MATATTLPVPAGLPSPRSPTLSDAGMILPDEPLRSYSPSPYIERPPMLHMYRHPNPSQHTIKLASVPQGRRGPSPQVKSPPLSQRSSQSTLRNMSDSDTPPRKPFAQNDAIPSSPTIENTLGGHTMDEWEDHQQRRSSITSSSVHSEDLEKMMKWPGFDSHGGFDDSGVALDDDEDEQEHGQFPAAVSTEEELENDRWLNEQEDGDADDDDDDTYNSAALSRRAEIILANAKKRLNVMEGNLRGARQSLVVSPTFGHNKTAPELAHQLSLQRERDRRLYSGMGPIPPRARAYQSSPLSTNNSPGHSRVLSETSVASPYTPMNAGRLQPSKRASSAMGVGSGPWSPEGYGQGRFPIRESRSFEVVRDRQPSAWNHNEERERSLHSGSRSSASPPHALETLPEDDDADVDQRALQRRPSSTTIDLRTQMQDLKGRISSLKQRAVEDKMRRSSLQSLRTPSPFTCADTWYTGAEAYKNGTSPVSADAGVGIKTDSPVRRSLYGDPDSDPSTPKGLPVQQTLAVQEVGHVDEHAVLEDSLDYPASQYDDAEDAQLDDTLDDQLLDVDDSENDFVSVDDDHLEQSGDSVYEDAVYDMPITERHEDRVDAFDYEHFFLHSAMGTYNVTSRRSSSSSSADSTATTRPVTAIPVSEPSTQQNKRVSYHLRNSSVDSVSTMASFATAAEEQSDDEDDNKEMDQFSQQILPISARYTTGSDMHADSATALLAKFNGSPSQASNSPHGSPRGDLVNGLQTSKIYTILLEAPKGSEPRLALSEEEKQLIYGLAASFQQVCTNLQNTASDQYERKEWRRRLDEARRLLNGEQLEGDAF